MHESAPPRKNVAAHLGTRNRTLVLALAACALMIALPACSIGPRGQAPASPRHGESPAYAGGGKPTRYPAPIPDFGPADAPDPGSDILAGLWQKKPVTHGGSRDTETERAADEPPLHIIEFTRFGSFREWNANAAFGKTGAWELEGNRLRLTASPSSDSWDMYAQAYQEDTGEPFVPPTITYEGRIERSAGNVLMIYWEDGNASELTPYAGARPGR